MRLIPVTYRSLFGAPGVRRLTLAALIGRLPVGVISLGLVLFVPRVLWRVRAGAARRGRGRYAIAQGVVSPLLGRLVDVGDAASSVRGPFLLPTQ